MLGIIKILIATKDARTLLIEIISTVIMKIIVGWVFQCIQVSF